MDKMHSISHQILPSHKLSVGIEEKPVLHFFVAECFPREWALHVELRVCEVRLAPATKILHAQSQSKNSKRKLYSNIVS